MTLKYFIMFGRYQNLEDLKAAIRRAWQQYSQLSQRLFNKSIDQWRDRLQKVVAANGGHIEHFFY